MRGSRGLLWLLLVVATLGLTVVPAAAQEEGPTDDEVNAIAKRIYCPVCENTPLDVCPTQACQDWRDEIRRKLAAGWTEEQIIQYFVERHGAQVLAAPPPEGLYLLVYILPPAAFLVGAVVLYRAMRSWRQGPELPEEPSTQTEREDRYVARVEEELRQRIGD